MTGKVRKVKKSKKVRRPKDIYWGASRMPQFLLTIPQTMGLLRSLPDVYYVSLLDSTEESFLRVAKRKEER